MIMIMMPMSQAHLAMIMIMMPLSQAHLVMIMIMMPLSQAHLLTGVHEQSYVAHLVSYAACLQQESLGCPASGAARTSVVHAVAGVILLAWLL